MDAICVVGAGGIGCAVGHALASAGWDVTFVEVNPEKVRWGRTHGVVVEGLDSRPAVFLAFDEWEPDARQLTILCTKCYDNEPVLARMRRSTLLLPIQNGFDHQLEARDDPYEGIASFVSECIPGRTHTRITRNGSLHLGPLCRTDFQSDQRASDGLEIRPTEIGRIRDLYEALRRTARFGATWVPNILPYKYTKLMYNAAISPLAAAAGLDNGQLLSVPIARRLFFGLLLENYAILSGAGIALAKIGLFHPATVERILRHAWVSYPLAWAFYPSLRGSYCSMSGDLPAGRTEIDYYNGRLIELAGEKPCPLNRRVYELVKQMERERARPGLEVLKGLARDPVCAVT